MLSVTLCDAKKHGNVIHHVSLSIEEAIDIARPLSKLDIDIIQHCPELKYPVNKEVLEEEHTVPLDKVLRFCRLFYSVKESRPKNDDVQRLIGSASDEAMFIMTYERVKPFKQLRIHHKNLTGSKNVGSNPLRAIGMPKA